MESEWREMTLGDVIELKRGYDLPSRDRREGSFPIVSSSGISGRHIEAKAKAPGVVIGRYGTLGEVHYITEDYWPLNTALYVRNFKGNDPQFVSYFLRSLDFGAYSDKAAVPGLNRNDLHTAQVSLPPLPEQRAIAHILGTLDDKIELNRKRNETLEAMARDMFKDWFVDFGPVRARMEGRDPYLPAEIWDLFPDRLDDEGKPEGWGKRPLSEVLTIIGGGTPKTSVEDYWGGDIPWFSVVDTPSASNVFVVSTEKTITARGLAYSSARLIPKGTTIISARGTIGNLAIAGRDMTFNQSCYGIRGIGSAGDYFIYLTMQQMVDQLKSMAHGSVFSTITRQTFEAIHRPFPIASLLIAFEVIVESWFDKILNNVYESQTLAQLRDTLLPKLISGELRVGDVDGFLDGVIQGGVS